MRTLLDMYEGKYFATQPLNTCINKPNFMSEATYVQQLRPNLPKNPNDVDRETEASQIH